MKMRKKNLYFYNIKSHSNYLLILKKRDVLRYEEAKNSEKKQFILFY